MILGFPFHTKHGFVHSIQLQSKGIQRVWYRIKMACLWESNIVKPRDTTRRKTPRKSDSLLAAMARLRWLLRKNLTPSGDQSVCRPRPVGPCCLKRLKGRAPPFQPFQVLSPNVVSPWRGTLPGAIPSGSKRSQELHKTPRGSTADSLVQSR